MTTRAVATLFVILLAIGAVVSACWPKPAKAQDHHPAHRDFYRLWMQPGVYPPASCCNARVERDGAEVGDCEPTRAELRRGDDGVARWHAWLRQEGRWLPIPDAKVIRERNPSGQDAHLCWTPTAGVLCFSPPDTGG